MRYSWSAASLPAYIFLTMVLAAAETESPSRAQVEFFESKIQPILSDHCYACHVSGPKSAAELQLDSRETILKGGRSGPAVVPAGPQASLLLQRILGSDPKTRMPLGEDQPLDPKGIADLKTWIQQGAFWAKHDTSAQPAKAKSKSALYPRPATPEQLAYFERNVRPIFVNRCYNCHSDAFKEAGDCEWMWGFPFSPAETKDRSSFRDTPKRAS